MNGLPLAKLDLDVIPQVGSLPQGSRMPLSRNPLFVGREDDLRALAGVLKGGGTAAIGQLEIAAATGLGGIGKTQLACEFVHRYGQFFAGGVFWLSFADPAVVPSEVAACGGASGMDLGADFELQPIDRQVQTVLTKWESNLPRLLVFDNCEDEALLDEWRPKHGGCRVIVTSRRQQWSPALGVQALPIEVLPRPESIALLRKFRPDLTEDNVDLNAIAEELGDLPLALHMAGSFLAKYRHAITPAQYLERLRKPTILDDRSLRAADISPTKHVQHVARTFEQSYERLDPSDLTDALAIKLLARAAYFAPGEPMPRWLLVRTLDLPKDDSDAALQAEDALSRLIDLGLLEVEDEDALRLHRLLAVFARAVVEDIEAQTAVEKTMQNVSSYFNKQDDPRPLLVLQPHLRLITDQARQRSDELAAVLCNNLDYHLSMIGDYVGARTYSEQALAIQESILGLEHPNTLVSLSNLGELLRIQGDFKGALQCHERALSIRERVLGMEHPHTVASLNNLGAVLRAQGDLVGARQYYEQALATRERVLGAEHPDTATSLNNLGAVLRAQGDLVGAQQYFEQALAIRERVLGTDHPLIANSLNNLGVMLQAQGDLARAREYFERALTIREQRLGHEHPNTQLVRDNLVSLDAPQTVEQQIAEVEQQVQAAAEQALAEGTAEDREALAAKIKQIAQMAEDGEEEGSPYVALAVRLRTLVARLRSE